jgi:hypothetical protein
LHNRQIHSRQFTRLARETLPQGKRCKSIMETNPLAPRLFARAHLFVSRNNFVAAVLSRGLFDPPGKHARPTKNPALKPPAQKEKGANPWHA